MKKDGKRNKEKLKMRVYQSLFKSSSKEEDNNEEEEEEEEEDVSEGGESDTDPNTSN
jgi:hypothetical protein